MPMRLLDFTALDPNQLRLVLSWRNHPNIRRWMLSSDEISPEDHFRFVESLRQRSDKRYFLVQENGESIGVIDFTAITEDTAELGIYANPGMRGVGEVLMRALIDYAFLTLRVKTLIAMVFSDNERAKHLYEKFDFTETKRTNHGNRELIRMELKQ